MPRFFYIYKNDTFFLTQFSFNIYPDTKNDEKVILFQNLKTLYKLWGIHALDNPRLNYLDSTKQ